MHSCLYLYMHYGISILYITFASILFHSMLSDKIQASIKLPPYLIWSNLIHLVLPFLSFPFLSFSNLLSSSFTSYLFTYPPIYLSIHQPIKSI